MVLRQNGVPDHVNGIAGQVEYFGSMADGKKHSNICACITVIKLI